MGKAGSRGPMNPIFHSALVFVGFASYCPPRGKIPKSETLGSDIRNFRFFASIKPQSARRQSCVLGSRRNAQIRAFLVANFAFSWCGGRSGLRVSGIFFAAGECVYPRKMQSRCSRRALVAAFLPLSAASLDAVCSLRARRAPAASP